MVERRTKYPPGELSNVHFSILRLLSIGQYISMFARNFCILERQRLGNDIVLEGTGVLTANDRKRSVDSDVTSHDDTRTERSSAGTREAQPEARKRTR